MHIYLFRVVEGISLVIAQHILVSEATIQGPDQRGQQIGKEREGLCTGFVHFASGRSCHDGDQREMNMHVRVGE